MLGPILVKIKRELNSMTTEAKYLEGHKIDIISNMDRILALVTRYTSVNLRTVETIVKSGKDIIRKVMTAESFDEIGNMEAMFKSQITLPVYGLFVEKSKRNR